jgi:hypothetical protein
MESIAPSLKTDSRGFPCLSFLSKGNGINEVRYSYYDGLKWNYYDTSKVYISQEDIVFSPDSLVLGADDTPYIVFARRISTGTRLSVAHYTSEWEFNDLDVDYEVGWIGIVKPVINIDHSSSQSSSSQSVDIEGNHYVVTYDSTNSQFRAYIVNDGWTDLNMRDGSAILDDFSQIKIDMCGSYIALAYVFDSNVIKYSFGIGSDWTEFTTLAASQLYGNIIDMDLKGYFDNDNAYIVFGWISKTDNVFYTCSELGIYYTADPHNPGQIPTDGISTVIEANDIDIVSSYIINGYGKIGLCLKGQSPRIIVTGASTKIFTLSGTWTSDLIDVSGVSNGIVPTYLDIAYSNDDTVKMSIAADSGDVYYFEPIVGDTFAISKPNMVVLSQEWAYDTFFYPELMYGNDIDGTYNNLIGGILKDLEVPVLVISNRATPITTTTTTLI